jgi:hypothetical protein
VVMFYEFHDTNRLLASWWKEYKKFTNKRNGWYNMVKLKEPYMHLMDLICRFYKEKYCLKFSEAWIPLTYTVAIFVSSFNWGAIISKQLSINILQAQTPKDGETSFFNMASYLLDVVCARNIFVGMNLRWHVAELPVHVYFNMFISECTSLYLENNPQGFQRQPKGCFPKWATGILKKQAFISEYSGLLAHYTYSPFMSRTISNWDKFVTRPLCKSIMPLW